MSANDDSTGTLGRTARWAVADIILIGGLVPLALYWSPLVDLPAVTRSGEIDELPFRRAQHYEQAALVVTGFVVKPIYTLLSLVLVIACWRSRAPDLAALRWAMLWFFLGENFCAVNYLFFNEKSNLLEFLHSYGMLLCFGFTTYAVLEGMDRRMLWVSDPNKRCAALPLCSRCIKYVEAPCGLRRLFLIFTPVCILLALMPLCVDLQPISYNTEVFGTLYNLSRPVVRQAFEHRYCPAAAVVLLSVSLLILVTKKADPIPAAKIAFAAGMGPLGFGLLRMVLDGCYRENLSWSNCWEELTELAFIAGTCFFLWTFRRGLFPPSSV